MAAAAHARLAQSYAVGTLYLPSRVAARPQPFRRRRPLHTHAGLAASIVACQPGGEVSCEGVVHCSATACRCRHPMAEFRRLFASHG